MSVHFVVGRAGSGKTHRCLHAIRRHLLKSPVEGPRLVLLVPEQASFQMERSLIEMPDLPGFTRCEVLSFQRLAHRIFAETGLDPRRGDQTIGSLGRLMVLRRLIRRERDRLVLLNRVADKPGLVRQVATALDELMRQDISPEQLAEEAGKDRPDRPLESAKLADLTRLYQSYLDYLQEDRLDPAQYLSIAAERLAGCSAFDGALVWVDGFAGFTSQEYQLLCELARQAGQVEMTMLVDPHASAVEGDSLPPFTQSVFARTERTMVRARRELKTRGVAVDSPVRLEQTHFSAPELSQLERQFLVAGPLAPASATKAGDRGAPQATQHPAIHVSEWPDRRTEVSAAIHEVQRLVRESNMRYRDIAVIVRDLGPYHDLIDSAMRSHGIPCFIDRRQPTAHHPLIELVRSLLAVACDGCRLESVRLTLKTGLLPLSTQEADLLENYLLASGIQGVASWQHEWTFTRLFEKDTSNQLSAHDRSVLADVNRLREIWLVAVNPWLEESQRSEQKGLGWVTALYDCLSRIEVPAQLAQWADAAEADGRSDEADAHRQVWTDFVELIDEFVAALGEDSLTLQEFRETFESGLAEFSLGLAPPTLDQVLVGAIERSRHPNVKAALILGFEESSFPRRRSEDPLLGDAAREALEEAGLEIGPSRRRQLLDERMLAYVALTRASERLWISYPRADSDGHPLQPSPYLRDLCDALPGLQVHRAPDPWAQRSPMLITSVTDLGGRLAAEFRYRAPPGRQDSTPSTSMGSGALSPPYQGGAGGGPEGVISPNSGPSPQVVTTDPPVDVTRRTWNYLYQQAVSLPEWSGTLKRALAGLEYQNKAELAPEIVSRAIPLPFVASVSRLEKFAACPFAHFSEYALRLRPRREAEMADVDLGTLCHAVLEKFVSRLAADNLSLADLQDDQISEHIDELTREVVPQLADQMMLGEGRNAYLLDRSRGHLARAARWQRDAARMGKFRPKCTEYPFGYDEKNRLVLETPSGRTIHLRGRIDRVDLAQIGDELLGLVIDYKRTTDRRLDLTQVLHGLTLQLVGYLLALQQAGHSLAGRPIRPVAALYLPLLEPFRSVSHPSDEKTSSWRMRGIVDASALAAIDESVAAGSPSQYLSARLTKEGRPDARSDLAERQPMQDLIAFVGRRMGELADRIIDGEIAVDPYRLRRKMPCSFCPYQAVCRYEILTQAPHKLDTFKRQEIFELITQPSAQSDPQAAPPLTKGGEGGVGRVKTQRPAEDPHA